MDEFGHGLSAFARRQPMVTVSAILCILSLILIRPGGNVCDNIDWGMLCTLVCFMCVLSGLSECGAFERLAESVVTDRMDSRVLCAILVILPLVCSMFITNDVALITFVPFAVLILERTGHREHIIPVAVLQTLAANTGCMITPFGSPHNLLVFSHYNLNTWDVVSTMAPYLIVGSALIIALCLRFPKGPVDLKDRTVHKVNPVKATVLMFAFIICIASVVGFVPLWATLIVSVAAVCLTIPRSLLKVNYGLLLTFVFLFILIGTLTSVESIDSILMGLEDRDSFFPAVGISQIVSNVPAATLLSTFTDDWSGLLIGTNVGGFGTPIASMASVITFGIYSKTEGADIRRFTAVFLAANAMMVLALIALHILL